MVMSDISISKMKKKPEEIYLNVIGRMRGVCKNWNNGLCTYPGGCKCEYGADMIKKKYEILGEYAKYTMDDFKGRAKDHGKRQGAKLKPPSLTKAKKSLVDFCFKGIENINSDENPYGPSWWRHSIMQERRESGDNVVIFGRDSGTKQLNPYTKSRSQSMLRRQGRTMAGTLILSQAIEMRKLPKYTSETYEWVEYDLLSQTLMTAASPRAIESEVERCQMKAVDWRNTDWLMIDGINLGSEVDRGRQFRASVLNSFFQQRKALDLPSILVFQFDVDSTDLEDFEDHFGSTLTKIAYSNETHRIVLDSK